jgi:hypothetical protein
LSEPDTPKDVFDDDPIRIRVDKLFCGRVGVCPANQTTIGEICKDGDSRYACRLPPGFEDAKKDKSSEPDSFQYGGLTYQRKFGDLLIWKQVTNHAKLEKLKSLVFLTDDTKGDWWWIVESGGPKTVGPRPELVEEIYREAGVAQFWMYNSEQFLKYAKQHLSAVVSEDSINQVRDIRLTKHEIAWYEGTYLKLPAERAVMYWLVSQFPSVSHQEGFGMPTFVVSNGTQKHGFHVLTYRTEAILIRRLWKASSMGSRMLDDKRFDRISIIIPIRGAERLRMAERIVSQEFAWRLGLDVVLGLLEPSNDSDGFIFVPILAKVHENRESPPEQATET